MENLAYYKKKLSNLLSSFSYAQQQEKEESKSLQEAKEHLNNVQEAQERLQSIAELVQNHAHQQISTIVTRCLQAVFGEESYEFRILFEQKRGKTEARLLFLRDNKEYDPLESSGGGVIDVASFALRLACLILARPYKRKVLFLDEPFKHLSSNYRPLVGELLESLSQEMQIQFVIVTHMDELKIGKVIEL